VTKGVVYFWLDKNDPTKLAKFAFLKKFLPILKIVWSPVMGIQTRYLQRELVLMPIFCWATPGKFVGPFTAA